MANPKHLAKLKEGVKSWNTWREANPDVRPDLTEADLKDSNLQGAKLSEADLQGAILSETNLQGAELAHCNLRGAILQNANLSDVKGLLGGDLGGSRVAGAKLPDDIQKFEEPLKIVEEASINNRKLFLGMLAGCVYTVLTIATTIDAKLLTNSTSSPLPIIAAQIPIVGFYWAAPLLLVGIHLYFQLYLQRLWEGLADLPAIFPDGRPLDKKAYPWLLIGYIHSHVKLLKENRPAYSRLQVTLSIFLAWWVVPLTLILLWIKFLIRHDWHGTTLHVLLLVFSISTAIHFQQSARLILRGQKAYAINWRRFFKDSRFFHFTGLSLILGTIFLIISWGSIEGVRPHHISDTFSSDVNWIERWIPQAFTLIGYMPFADLVEAEVSTKPPSWTGKKDDAVDLIKGARLRGGNLRYAAANRAFLAMADLRETDLTGADLSRADLRKANLSGAQIEEANFQYANLKGVEGLTEANLDRARNSALAFYDDDLIRFLNLPQDHNDRVRKNNYEGYKLVKANLIGADLSRTNLISADLQNAILKRANLMMANLERANLGNANLKWAFLGGVKLQKSNLSEADLEDAFLAGAKLKGAKNLTIEQLSKVKTLYMADLDDNLKNTLMEKYNHLFSPPTPETLPEKIFLIQLHIQNLFDITTDIKKIIPQF